MIWRCAHKWNRSDQYGRELKQENDEMVGMYMQSDKFTFSLSEYISASMECISVMNR